MSTRVQAVLLTIAAGGVVYLTGASIVSEVGENRAQERAQHATSEKEVTEREAKSLAEQVIEACKAPPVDPRLAPACEQAHKVKRTPAPRPEPARGISDVSMPGGHLTVTYTDGTTETLGRVVGRDGRGVAGVQLHGGFLVVAYTDGTTQRLGSITGPRGVGVTDVTAIDGHLVVTLSDGTEIYAGPLPAGPRGEPGADGDDGQRGPPGGTCPDGQARQPYTWPDDRHGSRCVTPTTQAEDEPE